MNDHVYLAHHGIKGQKWGIRRYQNPDGTLTDAGKKRYGSQLKYDIDKSIKESKNKKIGVQTKTVDSDFKNKVSSLRAKANSAGDEYNKLIETAKIEGKIASKRPEFKKSFEKKLGDFLGNGVDDEDLFQLAKDVCARDALIETSERVKKAYSSFEEASKSYGNDLFKAAKDLTKGYGDQPISKLKDKNATYKNWVEDMLANETYANQLAYLVRSGPEYALDMVDVDTSSYTMDDYNRRHKRR